MEGLSPATTLVSGLLTLLYSCVHVCYLSVVNLLTITIFITGLPGTVEIAPIAGGVVGGLIAVILVVLIVIIIVVLLTRRTKGGWQTNLT